MKSVTAKIMRASSRRRDFSPAFILRPRREDAWQYRERRRLETAFCCLIVLHSLPAKKIVVHRVLLSGSDEMDEQTIYHVKTERVIIPAPTAICTQDCVFLISPPFTTNASSVEMALHNLFCASGKTRLLSL